jgi:hypothetical protein
MRLHTWHLGPRRQPVRPVFLDELCIELANVALGAARRLRLYYLLNALRVEDVRCAPGITLSGAGCVQAAVENTADTISNSM